MKKNIGILFPPPESGGVFQYALSITNSLINYSDKFDYTIFYHEGQKPNLFSDKEKILLNYVALPRSQISLIRKILHFLNLIFGGKIFLVKTLSKALKNTNTDLVIIPTPSSFYLPLNVPYIVTVHDYLHKYYPDSPEYTFDEIITRDIIYKYCANHSVLVVASSETGVNDLRKFSNIKKEKVRIISYIPPNYVYQYKDINEETVADLLSTYHLPEKFIFYPAQFWYQKNHARLIKALYLIKEKHKIKIPLVLVGYAKGNSIFESVYKEIMTLLKNLGMTNQVTHLGYVGGKEMVALYKKATALITPSLSGPITIPPIEAMFLGTPVATTNLFEVPKQVGDAGLLFDPLNIEDMAEKIYTIWTDENLRKELIQKGYERTKELTLENYARQWEKVIEEALKIYEEKGRKL